MEKFSVSNLFPSNFKSSGLSKKELEQMVREAMAKEHPSDSIKSISYTKDGIEVILSNGETVEVEIDWNEFLLE